MRREQRTDRRCNADKVATHSTLDDGGAWGRRDDAMAGGTNDVRHSQLEVKIGRLTNVYG